MCCKAPTLTQPQPQATANPNSPASPPLSPCAEQGSYSSGLRFRSGFMVFVRSSYAGIGYNNKAKTVERDSLLPPGDDVPWQN